jgi:predicted transglutaminase-like cysteine proteinase
MSRVASVFLAAATLATAASGSALPATVSSELGRIQFEMPALAPLAYTRFCMQYPHDCRVSRITFQRTFKHPQPEVLTPARQRELEEVNRDINRAIAPLADVGDMLNERWHVSLNAGPCYDYAVTKRHELLARGWPSQSLLLAEVIVPWGEHHLVLVVRTNERDLVLDNLTADISDWSHTRYQWVRIQSPYNPNLWSSVMPWPSGGGQNPLLARLLWLNKLPSR